MDSPHGRGPGVRTAFVLGGGGRLGAAEVGMLAALSDAGVRADLVVGTSVGAINGAAIAADPSPQGVQRLVGLWEQVDREGVFGGRLVDRVRHVARTRTSLHSGEPLRRMLAGALPERFEDLVVHFECVAACIETAHETWFDAGELVPAVMASCAVPGLLPAVAHRGRHFIDGGMVDSIPVARALAAGATEVYVLQVGRVEEPLRPPRWPHEVALVSFEIARRRSFAAALAALPDDVTVHVLPTGGQGPRFNDLRQLRYRDFGDVPERIETARAATAEYLAGPGGD
jgi:NTE family protein